MFSWIKSLLSSLLTSLGFSNKKATIILLGLDNAGKTTLIHKLKTGEFRQFVPTQRAKREDFQVEGVTIQAWDLGGHKAARHLWKKHAGIADGLVYMFDSADVDRLNEAKDELQHLLEDPLLEDIPIVVMGNKADLPYSLNYDDLLAALGIDDSIKLFRVSILKGEGYEAAFRWLSNQI